MPSDLLHSETISETKNIPDVRYDFFEWSSAYRKVSTYIGQHNTEEPQTYTHVASGIRTHEQSKIDGALDSAPVWLYASIFVCSL